MAASFDQGSRSALMRTMAGSAALVVAAGFAQARPQNAHIPTETVLYNFKGAPDAGYSLAGLIFDHKGALYGATVKGGTADSGAVFKLTPPAAGQTRWTETVLYSFTGGNDGSQPWAGLIFDHKGALYGTTVKGGTADAGTVFKLTPPAAGQTQWSETVLYSFTGGDGNNPQAVGLIVDSDGALYGTTTFGGTSNLGTVFRLTPPAAGQTQWTETGLYSFTDETDGNYPLAGLIFDTGGALYGTTYRGGTSNLGTVFKLTPPAAGQTQWTEIVLYSFTGGNDGSIPAFGSLIFDHKGALYGTTIRGGAANAGTVFKLTPPAAGQTQWTETVLYCFTDSDGNSPQAAGLIFDHKGVLYGTTIFGGISNLGTVFKLTPPAAGQTQWTETVLYRFTGGADGNYPLASLIFDGNGALYGTTNLGGASNWGTVFKLTGINTELSKSRLLPNGVGYDHRRCPQCDDTDGEQSKHIHSGVFWRGAF
jgi:uncharacterized repeat protein (TIGR03803 family)